MSKLRSHSGLGRFPRTPLVTKKCSKCESPFHTGLQCNSTPRTPIPARRATERRSSRVRSEEFLDTCRGWKSGARCLIKQHYGAQVGDCFGDVCPDHERDMTGGGMKSDDETSYPACIGHHDQMERFQLPDATTRETRKAKRRELNAEHKANIGWPKGES